MDRSVLASTINVLEIKKPGEHVPDVKKPDDYVCILAGVDILQIGPFFSPDLKLGGTFYSRNFPGDFDPYPPFKCNTEMKFNFFHYFFILFFFKKRKKMVHEVEVHFLP